MNGPRNPPSSDESKVILLATAENFSEWIKHAKKLPVSATSKAGGAPKSRQKLSKPRSSGSSLAIRQSKLTNQGSMAHRQKKAPEGLK